mmetsp:Transcript_47112/g.132862  ORF Transcript_47112/g.132862 Transcript_47112/m.132862 type:complete len:232 (+) Transcript_47112:750-1445(+)
MMLRRLPSKTGDTSIFRNGATRCIVLWACLSLVSSVLILVFDSHVSSCMPAISSCISCISSEHPTSSAQVLVSPSSSSAVRSILSIMAEALARSAVSGGPPCMQRAMWPSISASRRPVSSCAPAARCTIFRASSPAWFWYTDISSSCAALTMRWYTGHSCSSPRATACTATTASGISCRRKRKMASTPCGGAPPGSSSSGRGNSSSSRRLTSGGPPVLQPALILPSPSSYE